ncbi:MAG TPA: DNA repair exonuclease [Tissierellaceae bacterium]|nr:DNA repair exonuclease [Tissierellaceae bacterium]
MIKFIHTGDIHLGLQFNNVSFDKEKAIVRRRELWSTFERIVDYTKENNADFLFIAGDLFEEEYFTLADINRVNDILGKIHNIKVIIIAGNHDYLNSRSLYNRIEWNENIFIFKDNQIESLEFPELNTIIYGYSWDRVEIKGNTLLDELHIEGDMNRILLLHGDISNSSNYLPLDLKELKGLNMDYIGLGHIHKPEIIEKNIAYCGSPEPLDFGETGERGFVEGHISDKDIKIKFVPFSKRKFWYEEIIINEDMGYQDIIEFFRNINQGRKDIDFYRIKLEGFIQKEIDVNSLFETIKDEFYHLEIKDNTIFDYDLEALEATYQNNIIGDFIKDMRRKGLDDPIVKDALYIGLEALLKE